MFGTLKTLIKGTNARAEEKLRAAYAIDLIDQKIREAGEGAKAARLTLASLMQRQKAEVRQIETIETRTQDLTQRAREALAAGRDDLANQAAEAIAALENELALRRQTLGRLEMRALRLQASLEQASRRIVDLKQGAMAARAMRDEQKMQTHLNATLSGPGAMAEAEELITQVLGEEDPFEQTEILAQIDRSLSHETAAENLAEAGFGPAPKITAASVLDRLRS
jgi:phage shock protein A